MRVLQANMHRSKTADALLEQLVVEKEIDVAIISEQYSKKSRGIWLDDETKTAAIWCPQSSKLSILQNGTGNCFVYVKTKMYTLISCYLTPSNSIEEFQAKLDLIEDKAIEIGGPMIIAGDFNSRAVEWGSNTTNSRGRRVLNMAARLGLMVVNTGIATTFRRPGCEETTPDITLASDLLFSRIKEWKVLEDFTGSDHQYITYVISTQLDRHVNRRNGTRKWNVSKLNRNTLLLAIDTSITTTATSRNAIELVNTTMKQIAASCNVAMPKIVKHSKPAVYWWTEEIGELRRTCLRKRRKYTRERRRGLAETEATEYKNAKKTLKLAIDKSKKIKFEELRSDLNKDPWGLGYKIVLKKLTSKAPNPLFDDETVRVIVDGLFPTHVTLNEEMETIMVDTPIFVEDELINAAKTLKNNKAPGPDGIPAEVIKLLATDRPQLLLDMYNACVVEGIFPEIWKKQKLTLLSKGKGDPTHPSAYRPLCMLDVAGKLLEKMLKRRLNEAIENSGGLCDRQHGFRNGKSTMGAIDDVIESVSLVQRRTNISRKIVLLATLDIRNAFNSLRWVDIIKALHTFNTPSYLLKIVRSYLSNRELIYETSDGTRRKKVTSGAAQGSILGPDLWNITYDEILRIEMPDDTYLVGYADDIAAVITARNTEEAQRKLTQVMLRTRSWLEDHGLSLATEKTELILLTKKHISLETEMRVLDTTLTTKREMRYLGVRLDSRLNFSAQMKYAADKTAKITGMLSKLMANVGGPTQSKRKLLMATTNSVLLYGSEIWGDKMTVGARRQTLLPVQRTAALRVASAYRTVSESAVMVISGTIPIDLLAQERKKLWDAKKSAIVSVTKNDARIETMDRWQQRWETSTTGRWTALLIPNLKLWVEREFGEVNYYITQFLSGHGYFRKYLHRMGKVDNPTCIFGDCKNDDALHTFFHCEKWRQKREELEIKVGPCNVDNIITIMTSSEENWRIVAVFLEDILRKKKILLDADQSGRMN